MLKQTTFKLSPIHVFPCGIAVDASVTKTASEAWLPLTALWPSKADQSQAPGFINNMAGFVTYRYSRKNASF